MRSRQLKILYFYLQVKFRQIKKQISEKDSAEGIQERSQLSVILEKIKIATFSTIILYTIFGYLNFGLKLFTREGLSVFSFYNLVEVVFAFFFFLTIFWSHTRISDFVHSTSFTKAFKNVNPLWKPVAEAVLVLFTAFIALSLVNFLPLFLLYPEVHPKPENLRVGYILSGVISLFFYFYVEKNRNQKKLQAEMLRSAQLQKENFEAELQNLKNQVSPHFLFNSLNVLASLIPLDQKKAAEFTRRLSDLYRSLLENSSQQLISLRKELEVMNAYIYLLETRFGEAVKFHVDIPSEMKDLHLPPGAIQLLLENAIKHNGSTRKNPLKIWVYTEEEKLIVRNNLQPRMDEISSTKKGLKNIKSRYKYFSDEEIEVIESESEFIVKLPLLKKAAHEDLDY